MTNRTVTVDDWSRGEFGDIGPRLPPEAGPGWFSGRNVMRYRSGMVGPRPGLRALVVDDAVPAGPVRAMWDSAQLGVLIADQLRCLSVSGGVVAVDRDYETHSIPQGELAPPQGHNQFGNDWVLVPGEGLRRGNRFGTGVQAVEVPSPDPTGAGYGRAFGFWKERMYVSGWWGQVPTTSRVWYSQPGNDGYLDVDGWFTADGSARGFLPLRNGLVILRASGLDLLSGSPATTGVLRSVSNMATVLCPQHAAVLERDVIVMMPQNRPYPMLWNGALWEELEHLRFAGPAAQTGDVDRPGYHVVALEGSADWMVLSGGEAPAQLNRAIMELDGCRTVHTWATRIGPFARALQNGTVVLTDGGAPSQRPAFWMFDPRAQRPGFVSDTRSQPGDGSDTPLDAHLHLPEEVTEDGTEVLVRSVIIDARKWATGSPVPNGFSVRVMARRRFGAAGPAASQTVTFTEPGSAASTDGTDFRATLNFGTQGYGGGWQILIDQIRGCAIRSVTALVHVRAERGQ